MLQVKLKEFRVLKGLSQQELAELVNVRRETIGHLERGEYNPSLKLAFDIAKVFSVPIEKIFTYTDE
ncbi:DNA-binding transcriptional regulator, XRE-family HTH domain [Granulicatella balaenopterae]|uniref:DNA-binding transcriptional regulator, XRE-family HTH domain n=2 Tax=Granulicatella balaenopterae TaxID=137733 RepID=A0A1H9GQ03_9LACT|nr:DNA-binding transcriptional regulator, XRE-family HTH domain [Granulicatella balaenopterae]